MSNFYNSSHYELYESECNRSLLGEKSYKNDYNRCAASLWAPSTSPHFTEDRAFSLYAMDCSRKQQIEKVIDLMAAQGDQCNDFEIQCQIYDIVGIDSDTFTEQEVNYIEREVGKRL